LSGTGTSALRRRRNWWRWIFGSGIHVSFFIALFNRKTRLFYLHFTYPFRMCLRQPSELVEEQLVLVLTAEDSRRHVSHHAIPPNRLKLPLCHFSFAVSGLTLASFALSGD